MITSKLFKIYFSTYLFICAAATLAIFDLNYFIAYEKVMSVVWLILCLIALNFVILIFVIIRSHIVFFLVTMAICVNLFILWTFTGMHLGILIFMGISGIDMRDVLEGSHGIARNIEYVLITTMFLSATILTRNVVINALNDYLYVQKQ